MNELDKPTHVYIEQLGRSFNIDHTTETVLKATEYRLLGLESQDPDVDPDSIDAVKQQIKLLKENVSFLVDVLGLNEKEEKKLKKLSIYQLTTIDGIVMSAAQGATTEEVRKALKKLKEKDQDDQKSNKEEKA